MLVPRNKLLVWASLVILPFSLLAALEPAAAPISFAAIGVFLILILVDASGTRRSLAGISVQLPAVARMSRDRPSKLELRVRNEPQTPRLLRLGLPLPQEIEADQIDARLELPADAEWSRFDWPCLPRKRGNYSVESVYLEGASP